jgi:hypothetical protein
VHLLLWPLLTVGSVTGSLRVAKGMLLILEYKNKAREGTLVPPGAGTDAGGDPDKDTGGA